MKKVITVLALMLALVGCGSNQDVYLEEKISRLQNEVSALEAEKAAIENEIIEQKVENGTAKYIVTFLVKQSHFTLDLDEHLKDSMNKLRFEVPVDKEFYDNIAINDVITDDLRIGSVIMKGSFGSWKVIVDDKEIR